MNLEIYNIKGQKRKQLLNETLLAGRYNIIWNGKDEFGKEITSGSYFCKLVSGNQVQTKKMLMLK